MFEYRCSFMSWPYTKRKLAKERRDQQKQKERFFGKRKDAHTYGKIKQ